MLGREGWQGRVSSAPAQGILLHCARPVRLRAAATLPARRTYIRPKASAYAASTRPCHLRDHTSRHDDRRGRRQRRRVDAHGRRRGRSAHHFPCFDDLCPTRRRPARHERRGAAGPGPSSHAGRRTGSPPPGQIRLIEVSFWLRESVASNQALRAMSPRPMPSFSTSRRPRLSFTFAHGPLGIPDVAAL